MKIQVFFFCFCFLCEKTTNISLIKHYASFNDSPVLCNTLSGKKNQTVGLLKVIGFCHGGSTFSGASFCPFNMYLSIGNADYSVVFLIKMI